MRLFAVTIFLASFLVFQVQPVIGKYILPWFGSTPTVWTTCLLFFQVLLLAGYAYAHFLSRHLPRNTQVAVHVVLLGLALLLLPITPSPEWKPGPGDDPTSRILLLLLLSVGPQYLLLSASGPLMQRWFSLVRPDRSPYRLYALSNAGAFLALLTYPLLFERLVGLDLQTIVWSAAWAGFAVASAACGRLLLNSRVEASAEEREEAPERVAAGTVALWIGLAACGAALLVATTNQLCMDIAVVPFLWILPLAVYLLTFVLAFESDRWYVRPVFLTLLPVCLGSAAIALYEGVSLPIAGQVAAGTVVLFVCSMGCHGELARRRPHPRHLTLYYLALAVGGAVGGLFVTLVAPVLFGGGFWEYHLLLAVSYVLILVAARGAPSTAWLGFVLAVSFFTFLFFTDGFAAALEDADRAPLLLRALRPLVALCPLAIFFLMGFRALQGRESWAEWKSARKGLRYVVAVSTVVGGLVLVGGLSLSIAKEREDVVMRARNFYGVLKIQRSSQEQTLIHGRIEHGHQFLDPPVRHVPTSYYGLKSGVGLALFYHPARREAGRRFRVGVVGLGAGTIAAYANREKRDPGDYYAFYEINPLVTKWAESEFTYLSDARKRGAEVEVFPGDARLVLERQLHDGEGLDFDVLAIDAFQSDAIPIHLLTDECFRIYLAHLAEGGILAFHVTNRHLDLTPVVRRLADRHDLWAVFFKSEGGEHGAVNEAHWVLVTKNCEFLEQEAVRSAHDPWPATGPLWTDDYSSVISLLK